LPKDKALIYAANTMAGAARMMQTSDKTPAELKQDVCSPGGSTIRGVEALENHNIRRAAADCVAAAYQRNIELGK